MTQQEQPVTQKDFELFKQSIDHRFELYLSKIDEKIKETISDKLNTAIKWVVGVTTSIVTIFLICFVSYFEFMRNKVDQVNSERISQVESNIAVMNQYVIGVLQEKLDIERNKNRGKPTPTGGKKRHGLRGK